ncbi:glycosyltransferase family 2 protein [Candidatus Woesearchaeota archaeon]|nr:glycosyltransferase family 2 protein [Candidatus Woesearchaeota archaeon]
MKLSIVIPTFNEAQNVPLLHDELSKVLKGLKHQYEIIFVDDGSNDGTRDALRRLASDKNVKVLFHRRNFGQTAAMDSGFKYAHGDIIITMDADLQNDPADIPKLLAKLDEGYDVVSGWRKHRQDPVSKKLFSRIAGSLRRMLTREKIHDSGCTLKAYRKECFANLDLYGEMHRYIPAILTWRGFRVTEIVVNHRARKFGTTKYGMGRILRGFLDLLIVKFWMQYSARPIQLFGRLGLCCFALGFFAGLYLLWQKFADGQAIANRPLLLLVVLLVLLGVQFFGMGVITDALTKIYYRSSPISRVSETLE